MGITRHSLISETASLLIPYSPIPNLAKAHAFHTAAHGPASVFLTPYSPSAKPRSCDRCPAWPAPTRTINCPVV
jgi:hypothetical protein